MTASSAPDGATQSGAAASAELWRNLPSLRPLGRMTAWPRLPAALEIAYRGFLRLRPRLQGLARRWEARRRPVPAACAARSSAGAKPGRGPHRR